jgi:phosphoribosylaminoimidazole carboxylase PurE protein
MVDTMEPISVLILVGSRSDLDHWEEGFALLDRLKIDFEAYVSSAHRMPDRTRRLVRSAEKRGAKAVIACAGMAAHLAGVVASETLLPVIGVPMPSEPFGGRDSLLSTVQMPKGVPVATVAVGKAGTVNAAVLAAEILALSDKKLRDRLRSYRRQWGKSTPKSPVRKRRSSG